MSFLAEKEENLHQERQAQRLSQPQMMQELFKVESSYRPDAVSEAGAVGLGQLMPDTARELGLRVDEQVDERLDPELNAMASAQYLDNMFERYHGNPKYALMAYHSGPGNVDKWLKAGKPDRSPGIGPRTWNYVDNLLPTALDTLKLSDVYDETAEPVYVEERQEVETGEISFEELSRREAREEAVEKVEPEEISLDDLFEAEQVREPEALPTQYKVEERPAREEPIPEEMLEADPDVLDRTVGQPLLRGYQQFLAQGSTALDFVDYYATHVRNEVGKMVGFEEATLKDYDSMLSSAADGLMRYAQEVDPDPSTIPQAEKWYDYLEPDRIYQTFAEGVPTLAALVSATLVSRKAGFALTMGLYGGQTLERMQEFEQETGEEIDSYYKNTAPVVVGALSGALQLTGIDKILKAARVPGIKNRLLNVLIAGGAEGSVELGQEVMQVLAEVPYTGEIAPDAGQRLVENFYAGVVLGLGSSGVTAGIGTYAEYQSPAADAQLAPGAFVKQDDGTLSPRFLVTRRDHPMQGQLVDADQLSAEGLTVPPYRTDALRQQMQDMGTPEHVQDMALMSIQGIANKLGMRSEEFIDKYIAGVFKADRIRKGDKVLAPDILEDHATYREWNSIIERLEQNEQAIREEGVTPKDQISRDRWIAEAINNDGVRRLLTKRHRSFLRERQNREGIVPDSAIMYFNRLKDNIDSDRRLMPYRPDGIMRYTEQGKALIGVLNAENHRAIVQGLGEVIYNTSSRESLQTLEGVLGIKEGQWTDKNKRQFGLMFERFVMDDKAPTERLRGIFESTADYLSDIYGSIVALGDVSAPLPAESVNFFNNMFDLRIAKIPDQPAKLRAGWNKFMDFLGVEQQFARFGIPETGTAVKLKWSIEDFYINEGLHYTRKVGKLLKGDKDKMLDAALIAESKSDIDALMRSRDPAQQNMKEAVRLIREYLDNSAQQLQAVGALKQTFQQYLTDQVNAQIEQALKAEDRQAAQDLMLQLEQIADIEFIHIPLPRAWFTKKLKEKPHQVSKAIKGLVDQKRTTFRLKDLIDDNILTRDEVTFADIMGSYAQRKGNDMALYEIKRAAVKEGAAVKGRVRDPATDRVRGYLDAPAGAGIFAGHQVNPALRSWLAEVVQLKRPSTIRGIMNAAKMYAFYNPLFLPMYDIIQSSMAGALNPFRPFKSYRLLSEAYRDIRDFSPDYQMASLAGRDGKPFAPPFHTRAQDFHVASNAYGVPFVGKYLGIMLQDFSTQVPSPQRAGGKTQKVGKTKAVSILPIRMGQTLYRASWDLAWTLDSWVRQATYRDGIERGMTVEKAAQRAALSHADYASVPQSTRQRLNKIFFTPTFKIAMGKFLIDSLNNAAQVVAGDKTPYTRVKAGTLMRTLAIMVAFDVFMRNFDFEREEFGRTYKQPVSTDIGPRDLAVTWSGPHNLFLKYWQRLVNAFGPEVPNPVKRFFQTNSWELHPFWRVGSEVVNNRGKDGEPIFFVFDRPEVKMLESLRYTALNIFPMYEAVLGEDLGEHGRELLVQEHGQLFSTITRPFWFAYERQPEALRKANTIRSMVSQMEEEVGIRGLQSRILRGDRPEDILEYLKGAEGRIDQFTRRLDLYIDEMRKSDFSEEAINEAYMEQVRAE